VIEAPIAAAGSYDPVISSCDRVILRRRRNVARTVWQPCGSAGQRHFVTRPPAGLAIPPSVRREWSGEWLVPTVGCIEFRQGAQVASVPARSSAGFTLIELMIALAVVAFLAGIAIPQYGDHMQRSRLTAAAAALKDLRARMEQRYADNRTYAAGAGCAIPAFSDDDIAFSFTCTTANAGQRFTWTATGIGRSAGFVYAIDESGVQATTAVRTGWTTDTLPVNRFIVRKGG